jgi:hypothetical protein
MMPAVVQAQSRLVDEAGAAAVVPISSASVVSTVVHDAGAGRRVLLPLYVSYAALQALDVYSTTRALNRGGVEANPLMAGVAGNPVALSILKAGGAAATIVLADRLRKRSRVGAVLLMAGVNSFYGMVVAHNYRLNVP